MQNLLKILSAILIAAVIFGCGSGKSEKPETAEEMFKRALELYEDEDYKEAENLFDAIRLQYTASQYSDDAQYYIAEINFNTKRYILSAFNYNRLRSQYPGSNYTQEALYKEALSYYESSPSFHREQKYTDKAINAFKEFKYLYPDNDSLFKESEKRILELKTKLARKDYSIANLYMNMDDPRAAKIYFDFVVKNYENTEYYQDAYIGKINSLVEMKKFEEVKSLIKNYKTDFPDGKYIDEVKSIEDNTF